MFGAKTELADACRMIDRALDAGLNFFDTANVYSRGKSEEFVGEALKRNGRRNRVVLATKVHGRMADDDPNAWGSHRRQIIEACDASLRRLQTDWIDLYQLHKPIAAIPIDESLRALDDLIRAGKVRYGGTTTFAAWQLVESLWVSKEYGLNRFVCDQPGYNLLDRRAERELLPMARTYGFGIIPWSPLAGGLLTGKYQRNVARPAGSRFGDPKATWLERRVNDRVFDVVEGLTTLATAKHCTVSQLALAWSLRQPGVTAPIIGPRTLEQLEDNLGALNVAVSDDDCKKIDEFAPPGRMISTFYEADFGPHAHRW